LSRNLDSFNELLIRNITLLPSFAILGEKSLQLKQFVTKFQFCFVAILDRWPLYHDSSRESGGASEKNKKAQFTIVSLILHMSSFVKNLDK